MTPMDVTHDQETADAIARARLISAALPYMLRYDDKVVVVKYGGHAMGDPELAKAFARDITLLETSGVNPVVVHGGGPQIGEMLEQLGIKSRVPRRPARHRQARPSRWSRWCSPARSTKRS